MIFQNIERKRSLNLSKKQRKGGREPMKKIHKLRER